MFPLSRDVIRSRISMSNSSIYRGSFIYTRQHVCQNKSPNAYSDGYFQWLLTPCGLDGNGSAVYFKFEHMLWCCGWTIRISRVQYCHFRLMCPLVHQWASDTETFFYSCHMQFKPDSISPNDYNLMCRTGLFLAAICRNILRDHPTKACPLSRVWNDCFLTSSP